MAGIYILYIAMHWYTKISLYDFFKICILLVIKMYYFHKRINKYMYAIFLFFPFFFLIW